MLAIFANFIDDNCPLITYPKTLLLSLIDFHRGEKIAILNNVGHKRVKKR